MVVSAVDHRGQQGVGPIAVAVARDAEAQPPAINGAGTTNGKGVVTKQISQVATTVEEVAKEEHV